jgi:hypothetical protein
MHEAIILLVWSFAVVPTFAVQMVSKPSNVALTIYNQNFALVKEERTMNLEQGVNYVSVQDVAATIEPNSVAFKSLTDPNAVVVREQNYQYDLISPATILNKSVGKRVKVRRIVEGKVTEVEGTLLSTVDNGRVIQTSDGILLDPVGEIEVMELPEGLTSRPTLVWKLEASKGGEHKTEISYLANQISWIADYVAVIDPLEKYVDLTGWVTLTNNSGTTYENASLNLMAGDVRRVEPVGYKGRLADMGGVMAAEAAAPQFTEKSFFEYHLYTLQGKTTVRDKETKQLTLIQAARVPAKKLFIYDGRMQWWRNWRYGNYRPGESYDVSANKKVNVFIEVANTKENHLGIPLPKGKVKVYKEDVEVNQQFIGEDEIDHTPKDEKIRLYVGDAFDIVGEHKRINFRRISQNEVEETFEISLRNHKDVPVTITVVEHLTADWKIVESSHKYIKKDASTVEIPVEVAKDSEVKVTYTVRTKW